MRAERRFGKSIRNGVNSFPMQNSQRGPVEAVPGRDPNLRMQTFRPESCDPAPDPLPLSCLGNTGKLRPFVQRNQAAAGALANMPVAMQADGRTVCLKSAHFLPKILIRRVALQVGIAVLRHHRQNRA